MKPWPTSLYQFGMGFQMASFSVISHANRWKTLHGSPFTGSPISFPGDAGRLMLLPLRKESCRASGVLASSTAELLCALCRLPLGKMLLGKSRRSVLVGHLSAIAHARWSGPLSSTETALSLKIAAHMIIQRTLIYFLCQRIRRHCGFKSLFPDSPLFYGALRAT